MSLTAPEGSQLEGNKDKPAVNSNYDNEKTTAETTKRKSSAVTRRTSFSMTRSWSSYAENYSSCLSGLRRNSSEQLIKRQGSLQSSPSSSNSDLSKSLDTAQLRNLKADTPDSEVKPRSFRISAMHARPFHQRRWSSPVPFSVTKLAPSSQQASKQVKEGNGSVDILQDYNKDKKRDKICETDEIILSQEQEKTPVSIRAQLCIESKVESKASEKSSNDYSKSSKTTSLNLYLVRKDCNDKAEKEVGKIESAKMDVQQPKYTNDETNSKAKTSDVKQEEPTQNRNIYTEIKKNTKWSKSKSFRRRHHTIHGDSRRFINPTLFTISEQSGGSFGNTTSGANERSERGTNGKLQTRRSKSLGDLDTLSDDIKTNGVSVQQLKAKSLCVSVAINKSKKNDETTSRTTTVKYKGEEKSETATSKRPTSRPPAQVNIQTFNKIQITPGIEEQQQRQKPQASKMQPYFSTQQHAVFTQPKAKWASITISQV